MKKKVLAVTLATVLALSLGLASAALAWQEDCCPYYYVDASYGGYQNSVPLEIELDGNPNDGQTFLVGDTIDITGDIHAYAGMCGWYNEAFTKYALEVSGPSGSDSDTASDYVYSEEDCAEVETITTPTITYPLTTPGTHTVYMFSNAQVAYAGSDVAEDFAEDLLTFEVVVPIEVEKEYRYTNVCFEKDNDLDGSFSEDPVNFEIDGVTPIDDDGDGLFNEDPVDCPLGTSLGTPLPTDVDGNYLLEAVIHPKNDKVKSYNPGQYYAVSTVNVLADVATLTIEEDWDYCDEISALNPRNGGGSVVIVQVMPDGEARQILDATSDAVTVSGNTATAVLQNVSAGTTILMYVKFGPGLKGEPWNPPYGPCENWNRAWVVEAPELDDIISASAWLKLIAKE